MTNKMVLFLCEEIWSMGNNKGVSSLSRLIDVVQKDFAAIVFTPDQSVTSNKIYKVFYKFSFNSHNRWIQYFIGFINYWYINFRYIIAGIRLKEKPDVIYISSSLPSIAGFFLKQYYNIPSIQRIYGTFLFEKMKKNLNLIKSHQEVLSFLIPADKYIITDDGTYGDLVAEKFGISDEKILFLRNGINKLDLTKKTDVSKKLRKKLNLPKEAIIILSVSRLVNWKRVDRTILAVNKLKEKNVFFVIVGDGEQRGYYESLVKSKNIMFVGSKTIDEVAEYMLASDIFVSMYDLSNLGNPLLEAMSAGLAIITLDVGNTKAVFNNENMILIPFNNEMQIIENVKCELLVLINDLNKREVLQIKSKAYSDCNLLTWEQRMDIEIKEIAYWCKEK